MRRTGLSYNAKVQPLLKHGIKRPEPEVDAPPLSTDESEDEDVGISLTHRSSPKKGSWLTDMVPGSSSDIEGDERNRKANIAPTKFASKRPSPDAPSYGTRKKSKRSKLSDDESISSKSTSKGSSSTRSATSSSARHLKDEHGFITTKSAKSTYGKRKADSSDPVSSQTEKPRLRRIPSPLCSPERPKRQFRAPSKDILSSPEEKPSLKLTNLDDILDSDPENDISPEVQALLKTKSKTKPKELRSKKAKAKARRDALKSPSPPPAVFKLPTFHDTKADGEDDYISSEEEQPTAEPEPESEVIKPATCPWCGVEVDRTLLESFSKGKPRLTVQLQTKFCKKHKTRSAKEEWKEKGYPEIDWDNLDQQFDKHRDFLLGVINGEASHYRSIMAGLVRSGKSRVLKQEDDLNPGYYGPRGFNVMSDYLVGEFRDDLKDRAVDDRVISGRGSAAFIQFVLVAELGTRLIMDDMGLDEDGARELMEKTKEIGIILHEDG